MDKLFMLRMDMWDYKVLIVWVCVGVIATTFHKVAAHVPF